MSKYICLECGAVFDENEIIEVIVGHHPWGETTAAEWGCACPECESTEISEAIECESCGKWFPADEAEYHPITEETICYDCADNLRAFADHLRDEAIDDRVLHAG